MSRPEQTRTIRKPGLVPAVLFVGLVSALLGLLIGLFVLNNQLSVKRLATHTRDSVLPEVLERQRSVVNLERLGRYGDAVLTAHTPRERRNARLLAQVLAQNFAFESNPDFLRTTEEAGKRIKAAANLLDLADKHREDAFGLLLKLDSAILVLETDLTRDADTLPQSKPDLNAALKTAYFIRALLIQCLEIPSPDNLAIKEADLAEALDRFADLAFRMDPEERSGSLVALRNMLSESSRVIHLQRQAISNRALAEEEWDKSRKALAEASDSMSTDAAADTHESLTRIANDADRMVILTFVGMSGFCVIILLLVVLTRRNIILPLLQVTKGLRDADQGNRPLIIPAAGIREIHDLGEAVMRFGAVHAQVSERTKALEREIAERARVEEELFQAKEASEKANRAKSAFLAAMSHEIRTPMNAILGMASMLEETGLKPEQRRFVETLNSAGEGLLELINDILDISRVEAGKFKMEAVGFDPVELVNKVCGIMAVRAEKKNLTLDCRVSPELPRLLTGDPARLRQVLINLVENSVKFTDAGRIVVKAERDPSCSYPGALLFTVSDTGRGIPKEMYDSIFLTFSQVANTGRGGAGLGLAICKQLTELMGGRIWLQSSSEKGSVFKFTVRFTPGNPDQIQQKTSSPKFPDPASSTTGTVTLPPAPADRSRADSDGHLATVLLVDDNLANQSVIQLFVRDLPIRLLCAENGEQALEVFENETVDLVLMDLEMPIMDGYETTRAMRRHERDKGLQKTPILALTAHAFKEHRIGSLTAGCDDFLVKPLAKEGLLAALRRHLATKLPDLPEPKPAKRPVPVRESLRPIIHVFFKTADKDLEQMRAALEKEDYETLARLGHSLKGSARTYGFEDLGELAEGIEAAAKNQDMHGAASLCELLGKTLGDINLEFIPTGTASNA